MTLTVLVLLFLVGLSSANGDTVFSEECISVVHEMTTDPSYRYIMFQLMEEDGTSIYRISNSDDLDEGHQEFLENVEQITDCRFAIAFGEFESPNEHCSRPLFILWCPSTAPEDQVTVFQNDLDRIKEELDESVAVVEAYSLGDLSRDHLDPILLNMC